MMDVMNRFSQPQHLRTQLTSQVLSSFEYLTPSTAFFQHTGLAAFCEETVNTGWSRDVRMIIHGFGFPIIHAAEGVGRLLPADCCARSGAAPAVPGSVFFKDLISGRQLSFRGCWISFPEKFD